jgi:hypothetical protein
MYQAMIALDNLGESIFAGRGHASVTEAAINRKLVEEFLARQE